MRKNKFFDTIMIALILMCSFKLLYPDAFTFNVTVNSNSSSLEDTQFASLEFDTFEDFFNYEGLSSDTVGGTYSGLSCYGQYVYADAESINVNYEGMLEETYKGVPHCIVAGINLYKFDLGSTYAEYMDYTVRGADVYISSESML